MYCRVHASPAASKVIVPEPPHAGLVTVITMFPEVATIANTLTCPSTPAASVAVSPVAVVK